ncbi:MAG: hypothetical protein AAGI30_01445 [Planctomycetota bacterium]
MIEKCEITAVPVRAAATILVTVAALVGGSFNCGCLYVEPGRAGIEAQAVALAPAYGTQAMGAPGVTPLLAPGRPLDTAIVFAEADDGSVATR